MWKNSLTFQNLTHSAGQDGGGCKHDLRLALKEVVGWPYGRWQASITSREGRQLAHKEPPKGSWHVSKKGLAIENF